MRWRCCSMRIGARRLARGAVDDRKRLRAYVAGKLRREAVVEQLAHPRLIAPHRGPIHLIEILEKDARHGCLPHESLTARGFLARPSHARNRARVLELFDIFAQRDLDVAHLVLGRIPDRELPLEPEHQRARCSRARARASSTAARSIPPGPTLPSVCS